jgi:two-component sensor histidine kinase
MKAAAWFNRLSTAGKLLVILSAVLLPIGIALSVIGELGIRQANSALSGRTQEQSRAVAKALESLIARNALALRVAANGALAGGASGACERARQTLAIAPAVSQSFELETVDGRPLCAAGDVGPTGALPIVAPGDIQLRIVPDRESVAIRVGVIGGMATALVPVKELQQVARDDGEQAPLVILSDGTRELRVTAPAANDTPRLTVSEWPLGAGSLVARIGMVQQHASTIDRLLLLLPALMWIAAALITWLLVSRLLIRPLRRLENAVGAYEPGHGQLDLPRKLGPSLEIQQLRDAFARAATRVEESEQEMAGALEGQRRLVREVHHRVKNNLQVVASLLNIHGRSAETPEASAAYASIGRRVGALSVVHRNHFAEIEESRGIALRPLLTELAAELRAGAPASARHLKIELEIEAMNTTQDVAVAVAFLVTEMVEFAMLNCPQDPIEIGLRRTSELTAQLTLSSPVLVPEEAAAAEKAQFERIMSGLAKQLRSTLERRLGRYSVDLPVFPAN